MKSNNNDLEYVKKFKYKQFYLQKTKDFFKPLLKFKLLNLFILNSFARIIDIFIFGLVLFFYYNLPIYKVNFLFDEINLYANVGFFLLFLIYGIISYYYLEKKTVGEYIFNIGKNKIIEVKHNYRFFLMIELCFLNIFELFKRALFLNVLIYFINKKSRKKEEDKNLKKK